MSNEAKYYYQVSPSSGVPIYRQIIDQVKTHVATGRLKEGIYLPSVRQVASELEVNPMTVSKAYSLLEKENVLEYIRGKGMKVQGSAASKDDLKSREKEIAPLLEEVVRQTKQLSLEPKKVIEKLDSIYKEKKNE